MLARPWKDEHRFAIFVLASRQFRAVQDRHIEFHLAGRMWVHPHLNLAGCVSDHLAVCTIEQQLQRTHQNSQAKPTDLEKFIYLTSLHDRNETLFFFVWYSSTSTR